MSEAVLFWGVALSGAPDGGDAWSLWAVQRLGMHVPSQASAAERDFRLETGCTFGHYDVQGRGPTWFLAAADSVRRVPAGAARPADPSEVDPSWRDAVLETAEELGLRPSGEPGWEIGVEVRE